VLPLELPELAPELLPVLLPPEPPVLLPLPLEPPELLPLPPPLPASSLVPPLVPVLPHPALAKAAGAAKVAKSTARKILDTLGCRMAAPQSNARAAAHAGHRGGLRAPTEAARMPECAAVGQAASMSMGWH
jgi:hypothetical protein